MPALCGLRIHLPFNDRRDGSSTPSLGECVVGHGAGLGAKGVEVHCTTSFKGSHSHTTFHLIADNLCRHDAVSFELCDVEITIIYIDFSQRCDLPEGGCYD